MTFLGKLLIVIQVLLSIFFMLFAGAVFSVQQSWKDEANQLSESVAQLTTERNNLQSEFEAYRTQTQAELTQVRDDAQRAQAQADALDVQLQSVQSDLETVRTERDTQEALAQIAGEEARARREETASIRDAYNKVIENLDNKIAEIHRLEDESFNSRLQVERVDEKHQTLLESYAVLQRILRQNNLQDDPKAFVGRQEPPPIVEGMVRDVRFGRGDAPDFVEITLGSDDGLLKGHELFVYRMSDEKYLGKIRIVYVDVDRAVGTITQNAKNGIIGRGDHVSTKL